MFLTFPNKLPPLKAVIIKNLYFAHLHLVFKDINIPAVANISSSLDMLTCSAEENFISDDALENCVLHIGLSPMPLSHSQTVHGSKEEVSIYVKS